MFVQAYDVRLAFFVTFILFLQVHYIEVKSKTNKMYCVIYSYLWIAFVPMILTQVLPNNTRRNSITSTPFPKANDNNITSTDKPPRIIHGMCSFNFGNVKALYKLLCAFVFCLHDQHVLSYGCETL